MLLAWRRREFHKPFPEDPMATPPNVVSTTMTDADLATALKHYDDLEALLSFLLALTKDQRQKLIKFGTASLGFVNGCLELVKQDSSLLPGSVSVAEFQKDVTLLNQL